MTTVTPVEGYRRRRLARHGAFAGLALLLLAFLIFEVVKHGGYGWALLGLFVPDVAFCSLRRAVPPGSCTLPCTFSGGRSSS